jgi:predicted acetylornithine/succinylornithine family transaminase
MNNSEIIALGEKHIMNTYARFPIALVRGAGMKVWDADGKEYLDFLAGIAVCNLGHCHPKVTEAITLQAGKLLHVSNLYHIEPQALLAEWLTSHTFADRVFFCNSGAEANEGAIKLARKYHYDRCDTKRQIVVSATMSFHGRTLATLTATGQEKVKKGFSPLPEGFIHVAYDDLLALESVVGETTAAVILEPVQGEGGVRVPSPGYLAKVRELCDKKGALLIFDEVQTGAGRTGTFLASEGEGVTPDMTTMAKGLGGGVPIGALLATSAVAEHFVPGTHATTFGGNPLSASAGLAAMKALEEENVLANCRETGAYFLEALSSLAGKYPVVRAARGRGLLLGLELAPSLPAVSVVKELMAEGFLAGTAGESVVRFAPPLIVTKKQVDLLTAALEKSLSGKS